MSYREMALADLLDAFASSDAVPGGGSAAALAGALGVSLLLMVGRMSKTRTGAPEETTDLAEAAGRLQSLRDRLLQLVDEDSDAYGRVRAALRLPRNTEAERTTRRHAVDAAMTAATATPLDTMRACQQALRGAVVVAANGTPNASSDVGVGVELLLAALRGARMNVDINLATLTDAAFVSRVREEIRELESDAAADADNARRALQ